MLMSLVFAHAQPVHAFGIDFSKIKPLTEVEFVPQAEFESKTQKIDNTPFEDEFLSYTVRLPTEWKKSKEATKSLLQTKKVAQNINISQRVLGELSRYVSPPNQHLRSFFTVEAQELTYEIGARNWFINDVLGNARTLEQVGAETDRQVEAIYVEIEGDITYIVRVKVIVNGPRMIVARYYLPQELYNEERILQAQVIKSFELTNREEVGVEKLDVYGFLDQSYFDYPVSWKLSAPSVRSIDRMNAMLYHSTRVDKLDGQINMYLSNKSMGKTKAEEMLFYRDKFVIENYELGKFIESYKFEYHQDMSLGITQVYQMNPTVSNMIKYELWVSVLENEDYMYFISLLTPARNEEFYTWARNLEAYKLVVKGMRRNDENVDYYRFIE